MFDLSNTKESSFGSIPDGKYICAITKAELKDTKNGTGQYIKTELTIKGGAMDGRKVWSLFNVKNDNPQAVEIGYQQLKSLLVSANHQNPNQLKSVTELEGLTVGIKTKTHTDSYGEKTEVAYFFDAKKAVPQEVKSEDVPF